MGMGEPLMNYNNVLKAIDKITSPEGLGMSPKRITLSTSGIPKLIKKMADDEVKIQIGSIFAFSHWQCTHRHYAFQ